MWYKIEIEIELFSKGCRGKNYEKMKCSNRMREKNIKRWYSSYCPTEQNANKVHVIVYHEFKTNARIRNAEIFRLTKYCSLFCNCFCVDKTYKNSGKEKSTLNQKERFFFLYVLDRYFGLDKAHTFFPK